jgi:SAM-dependent methyltransferase
MVPSDRKQDLATSDDDHQVLNADDVDSRGPSPSGHKLPELRWALRSRPTMGWVGNGRGDDYDGDFYAYTSAAAAASAATVVPYLIDLVQPRSVVDVGCGHGAWLAAFLEDGVADVLGLDGPWVDQTRLDIPIDMFRSADLAAPITVNRMFDLVVSLEVAEHLPATSARGFVQSLTTLGDIVLFSAAIPGQGGVQHVNEQWPSYWVKLFAAQGFGVADCVRFQFWDDDRVEWFYKQNAFVAFRRERLHEYPRLARWFAEHPHRAEYVPDLAHRDLFASKVRRPEDRYDVTTLAKALVRRSYARSRVWLGQHRPRYRGRPSARKG